MFKPEYNEQTQDEQSDSRIPSDPIGKLSDFIGSDGNSSEVVGILVSDSDRKLSDVGKCRNGQDPVGTLEIRHFPTSDNFLSESDTKDSDNFRRIPIGSDGVSSTWECSY